MIRLYIVPEWGRLRIESLEQGDLQRVHDRVALRFPYRANRIVNLLATMIAWSGERSDNPAREVRLSPEEERERPLTLLEIDAVCAALDGLPSQVAADAIRLLLMTGARKMECCGARWKEFDLETGNWTKPGGTVKGKKRSSVPLSDVAVALLRGLHDEARQCGRANGEDDFVFPGSGAGGHLADIRSAWRTVTREAGLGRFVETVGADGRRKTAWRRRMPARTTSGTPSRRLQCRTRTRYRSWVASWVIEARSVLPAMPTSRIRCFGWP